MVGRKGGTRKPSRRSLGHGGRRYRRARPFLSPALAAPCSLLLASGLVFRTAATFMRSTPVTRTATPAPRWVVGIGVDRGCPKHVAAIRLIAARS
jgi:hypothetical protein